MLTPEQRKIVREFWSELHDRLLAGFWILTSQAEARRMVELCVGKAGGWDELEDMPNIKAGALRARNESRRRPWAAWGFINDAPIEWVREFLQ
jgi:hypothetical protein